MDAATRKSVTLARVSDEDRDDFIAHNTAAIPAVPNWLLNLLLGMTFVNWYPRERQFEVNH